MKKNKRTLSFSISILVSVSLIFPSSAFANSDYASIQDTDQEVLYLGDILQIGSGLCWNSKKPTHSKAKTRLQIFVSNKWQSVGKVIFIKDESCKKNYYGQFFVWEVDRLGKQQENGISGKVLLRNITATPSEYSEIIIYASMAQYINEIAKLQKEKQKKEDERISGIIGVANCVASGGRWNFADNSCVPYKP